jgi:hypothetical protein
VKEMNLVRPGPFSLALVYNEINQVVSPKRIINLVLCCKILVRHYGLLVKLSLIAHELKSILLGKMKDK